MTYEYQMVQSSPTIFQDRKQENAAAKWLERLANQHASNGWEFYRVDSMSVQIPTGCFGVTIGAGETHTVMIVTFRRPAT